VLDANDALVGIITETDIFRIAAGMLRARPAPRKRAPQKSTPQRPAATRARAKTGVRAKRKVRPAAKGTGRKRPRSARH
jgi:CBS domain-containing protein